MPKINQEEYEILKEALNEGYEWIARDSHNPLCTHRHKPIKQDHWIQQYWGNVGNGYKEIDDRLFQFIQWEDEEPYYIAELIREYEWAQLNEKYPPVRESEETEVKKDIEWVKEQMNRPIYGGEQFDLGYEKAVEKFNGLVSQLDEPDTLSQEWISDNAVVGQYPDGMGYVVPAYKLQNKLVPKREEVDQTYKEGYDKGKEHGYKNGYSVGFSDSTYESEITEEQALDKIAESYPLTPNDIPWILDRYVANVLVEKPETTEEITHAQVQRYLSEHEIEVIEKPVISQEWFDVIKRDKDMSLETILRIADPKREEEEKFVKAWLAYPDIEIEQEPKTYRFTQNAFMEQDFTTYSFEEAKKLAQAEWKRMFEKEGLFGEPEFEKELEE